jgi:hypothetical protein
VCGDVVRRVGLLSRPQSVRADERAPPSLICIGEREGLPATRMWEWLSSGRELCHAPTLGSMTVISGSADSAVVELRRAEENGGDL